MVVCSWSWFVFNIHCSSELTYVIETISMACVCCTVSWTHKVIGIAKTKKQANQQTKQNNSGPPKS